MCARAVSSQRPDAGRAGFAPTLRIVALVFSGVLTGCNGDVVLPSQGAPRLVSILAGQGQNGIVADALADSLIIRVTDTQGRPVVRQPIGVNLLSGGAVRPQGLRTDEGGRLAFLWVLGPKAGAQRLEVGVGDAGSIAPRTIFTAAANPDLASKLTVTAGDGQVAQVGQRLLELPTVTVSDRFDNLVAGSGVTWNPIAGTANPVHAVSTGKGLARTEWVLGSSPGTQTLMANLDLVPGVSVGFDAMATPGAPPSLSVAVQPSSSAKNGVPFATQPQIQVKDASGAPQSVPGIAVTAAVASGGGALAGTTTVATGATGRAVFNNLAISGPPGAYTLIFVAPGHLTATSGTITLTSSQPSASRSTLTANPTTLVVGVGSSTVTVTVRDGSGTPIPGLNVTLSATGAGNTLVQPALTNSAGQTSGSFSSVVAGTKVISASVDGVTLDDQATITVNPAAATPDPATTEAKFGPAKVHQQLNITIESRDEFGNRLRTGGFAAHFAINVTGANLATPQVTDRGDGTYTASYVPSSKGDDTIEVTLDGVGIKHSPYHIKVK